MAEAPRRVLESILEAAGESESGSLAFLDGQTANLKPVHSVAGNPSRMAAGPAEIALDEEWRR